MTSYRRIAAASDMIAVTVDGERRDLPRGASLLSALLAANAAGAAVDFHCAIGQCQRCLVRVDGQVRAACLFMPVGGETIDTRPSDGRALPWSIGEKSP
jgi:aerobic-type carbon monoxide dehydrogenase small subunit (CoxS/CutS family)